MHRFQTTTALRRMRLAALLVCARSILLPLTFGGLVYVIVSNNQLVARYVLAIIPVTVVVVIIQILVSARTHCPLCMTPVLGFKSCNKHKKSRTIFGSYKLRVALGVIFFRSFRCPYCNEPTTMQVRGKR